jgi:hypothetical protein
MSYRILYFGLVLALSMCLGATGAAAENRLALVIGNSAYQKTPPLPNPANDARSMAEYLRSAGFEVTETQDLTQGDMRAAIGRFANTLAGRGPDTVAAVYYAGHGLQVDGENYLVPVDAGITREADVPLQAVRLADLMNALAAVPSKSRIVMLDACRNNPFSEINKVTGRGLAIVDAPPGTIISYSTSPGSVALDGDGANSPYTTAILSATKDVGLPIEQAFKRVRFAVNDSTNKQQLPWESSSLTSDFSFFPDPNGTPNATKVAIHPNNPAGGARGSSRSVEVWIKELVRQSPTQAYQTVIQEDSLEAYQAFLAVFPKQSDSPRVREVMDRRRVMVAWYVAVTTDTPASYQTFLASYANSDLAPTAQRLLDRANNRSLMPVVGGTCPCAIQPQHQQQQRQQQKPTPREQRASRGLNKKAARTEKPKRGKRSRDPGEETAASTPAPTPVQQTVPAGPPMVPFGIGIGIGGGFGRGMGGGGGGYGGGRPSTPMGGGNPMGGHSGGRY